MNKPPKGLEKAVRAPFSASKAGSASKKAAKVCFTISPSDDSQLMPICIESFGREKDEKPWN